MPNDWIVYDDLNYTNTTVLASNCSYTEAQIAYTERLLAWASNPITPAPQIGDPQLFPEAKNGKDNAKGFARWIRDRENQTKP